VLLHGARARGHATRPVRARRSDGVVSATGSSRVSTDAGGDTATSEWEQLYRTHYRDVVRKLQRTTDDPHEAENLAQEVFMAVGKALRRTRIAEPERYLWVAVRHRAENWVRDRRDEVSFEALAPSVRDPWRNMAKAGMTLDPSVIDPRARSAEAGMWTARRNEAFLGGLRRLSPGQRDAYVLVDFRGLTEGEAATVLGRTRSTVNTQRSRALGSLKDDYLLADSC
jgi:RNA polymerase sigma factor (sigma-70 family)